MVNFQCKYCENVCFGTNLPFRLIILCKFTKLLIINQCYSYIEIKRNNDILVTSVYNWVIRILHIHCWFPFGYLEKTNHLICSLLVNGFAYTSITYHPVFNVFIEVSDKYGHLGNIANRWFKTLQWLCIIHSGNWRTGVLLKIQVR